MTKYIHCYAKYFIDNIKGLNENCQNNFLPQSYVILVACFKFNILIVLELGDGWGPVIVDDTEELQLMAEQIRVLVNSKDYFTYWIGGLSYDSLEAHGYSEGKIK